MPTHAHTTSVSSTSLVGAFNVPNGKTNTGNTYFRVSGIVTHTGDASGNDNLGNAPNPGFGGRLQINATHSHSVSLNNTGGNKSHNIMQPYYPVYMWRRTA